MIQLHPNFLTQTGQKVFPVLPCFFPGYLMAIAFWLSQKPVFYAADFIGDRNAQQKPGFSSHEWANY